METDCIDLKATFGGRFKWRYGPSYYAEHGDGAWVEDPWLIVLLCQNGVILPWGENNLAAASRTKGSIAKRLKDLPFTKVVQNGDDGITVTFDVAHFEQVAEIMRPRKRRRLSPEQKAKSIERLAKHAFTPARQANSEAHSRVSSYGGDSEYLSTPAEPQNAT